MDFSLRCAYAHGTVAMRTHLDAGDGRELRGLPVAQGDGAGLVQQQGVHVAGGLDRSAAHSQHVALHQPVHTGDADRRQQRADRSGDQQHTSNATKTTGVTPLPSRAAVSGAAALTVLA